jgi:hypothetical protein
VALKITSSGLLHLADHRYLCSLCRLVEKVEKVVEQHPDLFTRAPQKKGYTEAPRYAAVLKPLDYPN